MNSCQPVSTSLWANAAVVATALGALVFVSAYAWMTRGGWHETIMGKHVMTFMVVILVVTSLGVAAIIFGTNWPHRNVIRTAAWGAVAACLWWRVVLLFRVQRAERRRR